MSYKKGIVASIAMKEAREGKFGRFANYGLKIDDAYYNGIASEHNGTIEVKDAAYALITEGSEVEFMFSTDERGYNNIDKKTLKVLGGVSVSQKPVQAPNKAPQSTPIEASAISMHGSIECLKCAIMTLDAMAKYAPVDKPVDVNHERAMKLAEIYLNWAIQ